MWKLSQTFRCLPSEILYVEDELAAYCVNRAIWIFATHVQASIDAAMEGKTGNAAKFAGENALAPWIGAEQKFRDPVAGNF